jgi:hypothetical protein
MKTQQIIIGIALVFIAGLLFVTSGVADNIEWAVSRQLDLKAPSLDVCASADGKWLYILSAGEVAVYSFADDKIVNRIPIDKAFDKMAYVKEKNALVVTSHTGNQLQIIQLDVVYQFNLSGLPYKGPRDAPVTLVAFGDYQ